MEGIDEAFVRDEASEQLHGAPTAWMQASAVYLQKFCSCNLPGSLSKDEQFLVSDVFRQDTSTAAKLCSVARNKLEEGSVVLLLWSLSHTKELLRRPVSHA